MLPVIAGKAAGPLHEALFWNGAEEKTAVRAGRWKLVNNPGKTELFDLEADTGEKSDLAAQKPEIVARLRQAYEDWSKANAPRIGKGGANDEDEGGAKRERRKKAKKG
jgi:arylsulfatase A-like enzyme